MPSVRHIAILLTGLLLGPATGRQNDSLIQVSQSGSGAYEAGMAVLDAGLAAAWYDTRDGNPEVYFRLLDADGRPAGPEHRVTNDPALSYEVDIEAVGNDLAIAWYEFEDGRYRAKLALWTVEGEEIWRRTISDSALNGRIPVLRVHDARIFVAWVEDDGGYGHAVLAGWWDPDGSVVLPPTRLFRAGPTTWNLNAKIDRGGRAWVVLDAPAGDGGEEIFLLRLSPDGEQAVRQLTEDDGAASKYPEIALGFNNAALTWFDRLAYWFHGGFEGLGADRVAISWQDERDGDTEVYLSVVPADQLQNVETRRRRVTDTPGESSGAYLAWNLDHLGLVWNDNTSGQHDLYFQTFDASGMAVGEPRRLTDTPAESLIPAIRPWRDGFAILWNEFTPSPDGIHGSPDARSEIFFRFQR